MLWFKRPSDGVLFKFREGDSDTINRLRGEGWPEVPEPQPERAATPAEAMTPPPSERAALTTAQDTPEETPEGTPEPERVPARPVKKHVVIRATGKVPGPKRGRQQTPQEIARRIPSRKGARP